MCGKPRSVHRIGTMSVDEFLDIIRNRTRNLNGTVKFMDRKDVSLIYFMGKKIKLASHRYQTFLISGIVCVICGLKGAFFGVEAFPMERNNGVYHMNLYAIKDGVEVLMTKDHIIPKSKGGKNSLSNYQTMCSVCNVEKGNKTT